ncbi:MAG: S9 family peptidase [Planctomycetes bacterium]|nr:S9 family peptidase [Planctomycetota bacterium]
MRLESGFALSPLVALLLGGCAAEETHPAAGAAATSASTARFVPPATRADHAAVDNYHGTEVGDPYRWLEDVTSAETRAWLEAQAAATERFLAGLPQRAEYARRLTELQSHPRRTAPQRHGKLWFWTTNSGLQEQSVHMVGTSPVDAGRVLLDPNTLSADGTTSVAGFVPSEDGSHVAYAVSRRGSDWREWRILETATGRTLPATIRWSKFGGASWSKDGKGFFYVRYPAPKEGEEHKAVTEKPQLCYHVLGEDPGGDQVVYERPDQPRWNFGVQVSDDGRYLLIALREGTDRRNRLAYLDLQEPALGVRVLIAELEATYDFLGNQGTTFWLRTDKDAPFGRIVALDVGDPVPNLREVVGTTRNTLQGASVLGGRLVLHYLRDAHSAVRVHGLDGTFEHELPLPSAGVASLAAGRAADAVMYVSFSTPTAPAGLWSYEFATRKLEPFWQPQVAFDAAALVAKQVFYQSKDGARVPMTIVHRRNLRLDGTSRAMLYGYGGFLIPLLPGFDPSAIAWVERGGVYASANLRGGSEYGEAWHKAGMLERKQNVFDDFVAAGEYLIRNGYTAPRRLAIHGRSNGGLLVAATLVQVPGLFGAAIPEVGVLDMLRYHRFTVGWAWIPEYGSSDDPKMFPVLRAYSPLHNLKAGTAYPPTLVMTGDTDDRVFPAHSFKFAAALQAAQGGDDPILLRVETSAGHGAGMPTRKRVQNHADRLAFAEWALSRGE